MSNRKAYEQITERVLALLKTGTVPWHKPWSGGAAAMPRNLMRGRPYRGINLWLLIMAAMDKGYEHPYWLTFRQARMLGGHVKKGEHGTAITFWKRGSRRVDPDPDDEDDAATERKYLLVRFYTVFNVAQCEGLRASRLPVEAPGLGEAERIAAAEAIVAGYKAAPTITNGGGRACYTPKTDVVAMPAFKTFESGAEYYSTLFHELTHSTGHPTRLNRAGIADIKPFGTEDYSKEELVAEFGATFLCGMAGIENRTVNNSAAYLRHWAERLRADTTLVLSAASQAQAAADHILGVEPAAANENSDSDEDAA
jgi:antirestriction protein ArdC